MLEQPRKQSDSSGPSSGKAGITDADPVIRAQYFARDGLPLTGDTIELLASHLDRARERDPQAGRHIFSILTRAFLNASIAQSYDPAVRPVYEMLTKKVQQMRRVAGYRELVEPVLRCAAVQRCCTRSFGLVAHVAAGKSTLTELMLFLAGCIHRLGDVHDGSTALKQHVAVESQRMTVTAGVAKLEWHDARAGLSPHFLNLIDTPGHFDFGIEVARSLRVLDGAVVLLDASKGIEPQTRTVWNQADRYGVPRLCFLNKMDHFGADFDRCVQEMRRVFGAGVLPIQIPVGAGSQFIGVIDILSKNSSPSRMAV